MNCCDGRGKLHPDSSGKFWLLVLPSISSYTCLCTFKMHLCRPYPRSINKNLLGRGVFFKAPQVILMDGPDSGPLTDSPKRRRASLLTGQIWPFTLGLPSPRETATQVTFAEKHIKRKDVPVEQRGHPPQQPPTLLLPAGTPGDASKNHDISLAKYHVSALG